MTTKTPASTGAGAKEGRRIPVERLSRLGVLLALLFFVVVFAIGSPRFLTLDNFINVSRQISTNFIIACAMTYVIITAGIDLSVGSLVALSGVLMAGLTVNLGLPWPLGILLTVIVLAGVGLVSGFAISRQNLQPFVVTLAMMSIARGLALAYTGSEPIFIVDPTVLALGNGYLGPVPVPVVIAAIVGILAHIALTRTKIGRYVYAVGGNEEAARISGINVANIKLFVYGLSGALSAVAGVIIASRLYSGNPTAGADTALDVIAAVVIGGTSLFGGVGGILGTLLGAFIVGIISNGLTIMNVPYYWQLVAKGLVIYVAMLIDQQARSIRQR